MIIYRLIVGSKMLCLAVLVVFLLVNQALSLKMRTEPPLNAAAIQYPTVTYVDDRKVQEVIDAAPAHSVVICNRNRPLTLSKPIIIRKPLTLRGINAQLPKNLGNTPLIVVRASGVTITDSELRGNADTVPQRERAPLLSIHAGDFVVERSLFVNSSKDGIMITPADSEEDITGGVVRSVIGKGVVRDVVSVSGGDHGRKVKNVLIEDVRCYKSSLRGAVEISDGTDNITVRKVYAEESIYAIDVQDHRKRKQINLNVVIDDVYVKNCKHAVRTANSPLGHKNLTIINVTAEHCALPIKISNTNNVVLHTVRIINHKPDGVPITIRNCNGLSVRDVIVENSTYEGTAMLIENCNDTLIDGMTLRGNTSDLASAVTYLATTGEAFSGLFIRNVAARNVKKAGIILSTAGKGGTITDYIISENLSQVKDKIKGKRGFILNNL